MKYSVRVIKHHAPNVGPSEELQYDVFQSSKLKVAYQRRIMEAVLKKDLRPMFEHPHWTNDVLDSEGNIDPKAKIDKKDQSNLRCTKIAYGDNGEQTVLTVQRAADDAEVTAKTRTTTNAENKTFTVQVVAMDDNDEAQVVNEKTVSYASYHGVKYALKESGEYDDYEGNWIPYHRGGYYKNHKDGNAMVVIQEVKSDGEMSDDQ